MIPHIEISFRELETDQSKDMLWRCYVQLKKMAKWSLTGDNLILVFKSDFVTLQEEIATSKKEFLALQQQAEETQKALAELLKDE